MLNKKILLVEDDSSIREAVSDLFVREGYSVLEAGDGDEMYNVLSSNKVDLIIMDINLPGKNGLLLTRDLKDSHPDIAVMFLTASSKEIDKILALEYGADHFMTKPFSPRELTIRVRNLFKRINSTVSSPYPADANSIDSYSFHNWTLDVNSRSLISPEGSAFRLAKSEFRAIVYLIENKGKILSRASLLLRMTGRDLKEKDRTVDVTIRRIRKHFETHSGTPEIIATIHGEGYRFCGSLSE